MGEVSTDYNITGVSDDVERPERSDLVLVVDFGVDIGDDADVIVIVVCPIMIKSETEAP